jgi:NAD+ synthase
LSGKSDEDNFGFTYEELDEYLRTGKILNKDAEMKISERHIKNLFKLKAIDSFDPDIPNPCWFGPPEILEEIKK